jgi:hypothetical protein
LVGYQCNWFGTVLSRANLHQKLETMGAITISKPEGDAVLEILLKDAAPCSIYVFGSRSISTVEPETKNYHFYILVLSTKFVTGSHLANEIKERTNNVITATVLVHNVTHLATKQKSQHYFFDWVLRNGQRIWLDRSNIPYILNHNPQRDLETDTRFWHKCVAVAVFNIQAAKESPQLEVERCKIALLHTACVQIALGLIKVRLGYTPNEFSLNYLLQLCAYFIPLQFPVFNKQITESTRRYKLLCAPPTMLYHWTKLHATTDDFNYLVAITQDFLNQAKTEIENANI